MAPRKHKIRSFFVNVSASLFIDLLEDVFEFPIVSFQYSVFSAEVKRPALVERVSHGAVRKVGYGLGRIVHCHGNTSFFWKVEHLVHLRRYANLVR